MNGNKQRPSLTPVRPATDELVQVLSNVAEDESQHANVSIRLNIRGGLPSQRYTFDFTATGDGAANSSFECALSKRKGESKVNRVPPQQIQMLLKQLPEAVASAHDNERFLPDTLLGILEISAGGHTHRIVYAADPEQAKTQGKVPHESLQRVIDMIHRMAAKLIGVRSTSPQ